jgi:hypothetical protein
VATRAVVRSWAPVAMARRCVRWRVRACVFEGSVGGVMRRPEAGVLETLSVRRNMTYRRHSNVCIFGCCIGDLCKSTYWARCDHGQRKHLEPCIPLNDTVQDGKKISQKYNDVGCARRDASFGVSLVLDVSSWPHLGSS